LDSAQRAMLLRMSGAYKTTPGDALNVILGIIPLSLEAKKQQRNIGTKHKIS